MTLPQKRFQCGNCGQTIKVPQGVPKPSNCPICGAPAFMIHRLDPGPPGGRRGCGGRGTVEAGRDRPCPPHFSSL